MRVEKISRLDRAPFILNIHYARRWPSISYAFGLFQKDELIGVVTYGTLPSSTLRNGIAGKENASKVLELNRLCLKFNRPNEASFLVAKSLKMLPIGSLIISFADIDEGHNGCVYRASNFTYHGLSAKRTDWKVKGKENLHGRTVADEFRGLPNRAARMREKYGDAFYLQELSRKHRYIYVTGLQRDRKRVYESIRYPIIPFKDNNVQNTL